MMPCVISVIFNSLGDIFGLIRGERSSENRRLLVGFNRRNPLAASTMPAAVQRSAMAAYRHRFTLRQTRRTVPIIFSIELVQASERRSFVGRPRRLTVSISSSPLRMLAATPGARRSSRRARLRSSCSALSVSSSSQACRLARRTEACSRLVQTLGHVAGSIWHRWIGVWAPMVRWMTLLNASAPSMMNSRHTVGSSPRSIRLSINSCTTLASSVAPSTKPNGCVCRSCRQCRGPRPTSSVPTCSHRSG